MCAAHLHVASGYSARFGASLPNALVKRAAERGITAMALTDRTTAAGTVRFAAACGAHGIRPIFGGDLAVAPLAATGTGQRSRTPVRGGAHVVEPPHRATFLAQSPSGWARLCRLVSAVYAAAAGGPPVLAWSALREHARPGLTVLLGPPAEPVRAVSSGSRAPLADRCAVGNGSPQSSEWFGRPT